MRLQRLCLCFSAGASAQHSSGNPPTSSAASQPASASFQSAAEGDADQREVRQRVFMPLYQRLRAVCRGGFAWLRRLRGGAARFSFRTLEEALALVNANPYANGTALLALCPRVVFRGKGFLASAAQRVLRLWRDELAQRCDALLADLQVGA